MRHEIKAKIRGRTQCGFKASVKMMEPTGLTWLQRARDSRGVGSDPSMIDLEIEAIWTHTHVIAMKTFLIMIKSGVV